MGAQRCPVFRMGVIKSQLPSQGFLAGTIYQPLFRFDFAIPKTLLAFIRLCKLKQK